MPTTTGKPCNVRPNSTTKLKAYDDCHGEFEIAVGDLPNVPEADICAVVANCPTIKSLQQKDAQIQAQVNLIENDKFNDINTKINQQNTEINGIKEKNNQQDFVIGEINDNITTLKNWNIKQNHLIESLQARVILDKTFNNFEEWVENVYIPQANALTNKYVMGDMYINVSQSIAATNATYVNVRSSNSKAPYSANDWQKLYYSAPADVLSVLGIDPIEVSHPSKHTWALSLNPTKFQDYMAQLRELDLSKVNVTLGEVYFNPVIKESATIQENLTVGNTTTTKDLTVQNGATIKDLTTTTANLGTVTAPVTFNEKVTVTDTVEATTLVGTGTATIKNATLTGSTKIERVDGDLYASENVRVGEKLTVGGTATFDTRAEINTAVVSSRLEIPTADNIKIGGVDFQTWLLSFGNAHWQPK